MRKFKLFVLLLGVFSFLGLLNVKAAPEAADVKVTYYLDGAVEVAEASVTGLNVGDQITLDEQTISGGTFLFWTVNGAVRRDLDEIPILKASAKLNLKAYYVSSSKVAAVFLDTNLEMLSGQFLAVADTMTIPADPVKPKATFLGWVPMALYDSATPIKTPDKPTEHTYFVAKYLVEDTQKVTINEVDYVINSIVTLTSTLDNPIWKNASGQIVGYGQTFKFTALENATFTASASATAVGDFITFRGPIALRTGHNSYVGSFDLGTKEVVEFGFILDDGTKAQSNTFSLIEGTNVREFLMSFDTNKKQAIATYVTYLDGTNLVTKISTEVYTVAEARAAAANVEVEVIGVVTSISSSAITLQDDTAAIATYSLTIPPSLEIGDKVIVKGKRGSFNGLVQLGTPGSITRVSSGHSVPDAVVLTTLENSIDYQSQKVAINNLVFVSKSGQNFVFKLGANQITLRTPDTTGDVYTALNAVTAHDKVSVPGSILGWYNGAQINVSSVADFVVTPMTDEEKIPLIKADLLAEYNGEIYNSGTNVELPTTHLVYGGTINWSYNPSGAVSSGKWVAVGNENITVTATASINLNGKTGSQAVSIYINYVDPSLVEEEIAYEDFESYSNENTYSGTVVRGDYTIVYGNTVNTASPAYGLMHALIRIASNTSNVGYITYEGGTTQLTKISFQARYTHSSVVASVQFSADGGETWGVEKNVEGLSTTYSTTPFEITSNVPSANTFRIVVRTSSVQSSNRDLLIDEIKVYGLVPFNPAKEDLEAISFNESYDTATTLTLLTTGSIHSSDISWSSSHPGIIDATDGTLVIPTTTTLVTLTAEATNDIHEYTKEYEITVVGSAPASSELAEYIFTSKAWAATKSIDGGTAVQDNWTSIKDGIQLTSGQGIQVTKTGTGASGTSPSFNQIQSIEVLYATNKSSGAGTIVVTIGSTEVQSFVVSTAGGVTPRSAGVITIADVAGTNLTGEVNITVNCTTNSIYIYGIKITYTPSN